MCVLIDSALSGFPSTLTVSPSPNPALATSGERSELLLLESHSPSRLDRLDNTDISEMLLSERTSTIRLVRLDNGDISSMRLKERSSDFRSVKPDNTDISEKL